MIRPAHAFAILLLLAASCSEQETAPSTVSQEDGSETVAAKSAGGEPVMIGGEAQLDACASSGAVSGLDPAGDNFLAVRAGPGAEFEENDRLSSGQAVTICEKAGDWLGVVYDKAGGRDCGVASPQKRRSEYAGPCRSGWVAARFVTLVAG